METQGADAALLPRSAAALSALAPLPHAVTVHIFSLVPADTRLRCREVCRGWRATLDDCGAWLQLDLRPTAGLARPATDALLHAAAARAAGQLRTLDVTGRARLGIDAFTDVVRANPRCEELRCGDECFDGASFVEMHELEAVFLAAPLLRCFNTDVYCTSFADALRMLRNERGFERLRVRSFQLELAAAEDRPEATFEVIAAAAAHASLSGFVLRGMTLDAAALDAVVDAALTRRVTEVRLYWCALGTFAVPALVRMLHGSTALFELAVGNGGMQLLDAAVAELLGTALRANASLKTLWVLQADIWREPAAAATLLRALRGHPSLRCLNLACNDTEGEHNTAGAELAALVAADAPALQELDVSSCRLGNEGLLPLCEALRRNTHLRVFNCRENGMTEDFIRFCLLPAVAANTSLRKLSLTLQDQAPTEAAAEAVAFVERRRADAEAAGERGL
jgi:hypothetical protein